MCPVVYRAPDGASGGAARPPAFMAFELFCRILEQLPDVKTLQLQGMGEPLLHPRFFDMVRYAVARGVEVSTNTNLTALSERRAAECVASGLHVLHVSLDAASPAVYEFIRAGSNLERVLRNLARLMEAKRRSGASRPHVVLAAVAMRRNLEELPQLVRLAACYGVPEVAVQHLAHDFSEDTLPSAYRPMRRFVECETLLDEDRTRVERWFNEARAVADTLGIKLGLPNVQPRRDAKDKKGSDRCRWPWHGAYVSYSGEAMPCCMIATPDRLNFGNVARDAVAGVWNNERYERFRAQLASDEPPPICRGCAIYNGTF